MYKDKTYKILNNLYHDIVSRPKEPYMSMELDKYFSMFEDSPKLKRILKKIAKKSYELECLKNDFITAQMADCD